jgi:hypothetical protein
MTLTTWDELCNTKQEDCIIRTSIFTQTDGVINHPLKMSRLQKHTKYLQNFASFAWPWVF